MFNIFYIMAYFISSIWWSFVKQQNRLMWREPDVSLLDGPSTSGIATIACATAAGSAAAAATSALSNTGTRISPSNAECLADSTEKVNSPTTPNSTASTAPLLSPPLSPLITTDLDHIDSETESSDMPAKSHQPIPVIVTTTTTAQIMDENRFSILGKDITTNEFDIYTLPSPPKDVGNSEENLNSSSGTTASQKSTSGSPHKESTSATTNESHHSHQNNGSVNNSPVKKKHHHRNHNNNQGDVNSIESITEDTVSEKIPSTDLDWVDRAIQDRNDREILAKPKKKKKNKGSKSKELDQLDGVPMKQIEAGEAVEEEDEKVVKCLYYTLMCCDCAIS
ncbi:putative uncharacterized protein DDB_G0291608 isoform X2 [Stomoxys calcitrans]|uniref:putative uncharacterized protein DDB_G0291608 isoform X2 n=1 Tax=Stomoxys calcitrans TaxID=35570 RepID=UPI0027E2B65B|nr:putative uncharacterized protein DDB_G0291608 isoform X2 [Stomoxys calcitrans]